MLESPCRRELTVTVLSAASHPAHPEAFAQVGHGKMNQGRPSEKKQLADLCWREGLSCTCAEWAGVAVGHMWVLNTLCRLAWRLLTASCSLPEEFSFTLLCLLLCPLAEAKLAGTEVWLLMQCIVGLWQSVAQKGYVFHLAFGRAGGV